MHKAVTTDDHLIIIGGREGSRLLDNESEALSDMSASIAAYSYSCNKWVRMLGDGKG